MIIPIELEVKAEFLGSLKLFTEYFYKKLTGREFVFSLPMGRESHYLTVMRALVHVFRNPNQRLIINLPPGHGKSTMLQFFVAWCMAHYPDSQFLYISYAKSLAEKHTGTIKRIMELNSYQEIFGVRISQDSSAKGHFKTTAGGTVVAFGSSGGITGQDAGLPNLDRFSGAVIFDDAHKPDEVHSDLIREGVITNYNETIKPRPRGENVPLIFLGQRLHEDDLPAYLLNGKDGYNWNKIILKAIDEAGNALCPNINSLKMLRIEQDTNPYVFAAQYQQDPQPAGGGIFKVEWFKVLDFEPDILATFLTIDTAETDKSYNDKTVFSFWGLHKIKMEEVELDLYGLHWIDCIELCIEPKDLQHAFFNFYSDCMKHKMKPRVVAIEKKSTGTTLLSVLDNYKGLALREIERTRASGSKTDRYLEVQQYVARRQISLPLYGKHTTMCIEHCRKITANNSHRFDDICDTMYDGIKIGLIDKTIINLRKEETRAPDYAKNFMSNFNQIDRMKKDAYT